MLARPAAVPGAAQDPASPWSWRFQRAAWLHALLDLVACARAVVAGRFAAAPLPEADPGAGPVALREVYAVGPPDDAAVRRARDLQAAVLGAVREFLRLRGAAACRKAGTELSG